ncbi:hypothetical protein [uncultured Oscillibacter sp.]|uniref:hypothetical protein n=1 Tax=uncultured Oscillibacter sp. TaxID=876091 RepID=UPI0026213D1A|nr:hypothetical protein [uncultured Oscillibacter sp.]
MPKSISYGHFAPGRLLMTANAANVIPKPQMLDAVRRHLSCDWGDVSDRDKAMNDQALKHGGRLVSAYRSNGRKFLIITEEDRSATTIMLAEDY